MPWADLLMAVNSVTLYAPGLDCLVAWQGSEAPDGFLPNPRLEVVRQPDSCSTYGEAFGFAVERAPGDELILMNDDAVLLPDTVSTLLQDATLLEHHPEGIRLGLLACRSNFAPGPQNVRSANGGALRPNGMRYDTEDRILPAARGSPVAAYVRRSALDDIGGFPPINWYSDDLMCFDLLERGYANFVSRAYVHHIGMRSTTEGGVTMEQLDRAGRDWIREHRPDFWEAIGSPAT